MRQSRMFGGDDPSDQERASETVPSPRTTIVGGRPPERNGERPPVPTGIERALRLAAVDRSFRQVLVARRDVAAEAAGLELTPNERAVLRAIPASQLEAMAEGLPAPAPPRRQFLQQAAASAVIALGGAALASCSDCDPTRGIRSDVPPRLEGPGIVDGIRPDVPPERVEYPAMVDAGGAAPDIPDELPPGRPENQSVTQGIAPDVPPPHPPAPRPQDHGLGAGPGDESEKP